MRTSSRRRSAPSQERTNAREQLLVGERAPDDVVGSAVEGAHPLDGIGRGREQDHGDVSIPRPAGLAAAQPEAEVELGEENEVGSRALGELERLRTACGVEDVEAVVAQMSAEVLARLGLGLGDEDGVRHVDDASRARGPRQMSFAAKA